jgi:ribose transport system permease protein
VSSGSAALGRLRSISSTGPLADARRLLQEQPLLVLLLLLVALVALLQLIQPGIVSPAWMATTVKFATPLAILAACQTLTMLTGGIDLSAATVASMAAFITATQATDQGQAVAIGLGLGVAVLVGLINGIGAGLFRVHPLIMTLGTGLVVSGFTTVYQTLAVATSANVPDAVGLIGGTSLGWFPNCLVLFLPLALVIIGGLGRSGYGRLLYAVGDNPAAARLAGVRLSQVLVVVYTISGLLAGIAGLAFSGVARASTLQLVDPYLLPSVAAAVIGGTSIFGGRGGYTGSIVGALMLTVLASLLTVVDAPGAVRQILYGAIILAVAAAYARATADV